MTCEAKFWSQIGCACDACDSARREQVKAFAAQKFEQLEWEERLRDARIRDRESMITLRPPCLKMRTPYAFEQSSAIWWEEVAA